VFGFVSANLERLSPEAAERYQAGYCGLCHALGSRHGDAARLTVNYDMTFLALYLAAVYDEPGERGTERCVVHPFKAHEYLGGRIADYAADMNVLLAYHDAMDGWNDDRDALGLARAKLLEKEYRRVEAAYPRQSRAVGDRMAELAAIEKRGEPNPDLPARRFGELMGEIFVMDDEGDDERSGAVAAGLRDFGRALGAFVYIMDACVDLERDLRSESYNPMVATPSDQFDDILDVLMAGCVRAHERLVALVPAMRDRDLIENILYSGVWTRYEAHKRKKEKAAR